MFLSMHLLVSAGRFSAIAARRGNTKWAAVAVVPATRHPLKSWSTRRPQGRPRPAHPPLRDEPVTGGGSAGSPIGQPSSDGSSSSPSRVVALVRIFAWDDEIFFALLNTVSLFVYLPAWIVAIVAGIGRRYVLAGAALLVVVAQLFFVLPEFTAAQPAPALGRHRAERPSARRQRLLPERHGDVRVRQPDQGVPAPAGDHGRGHAPAGRESQEHSGALADLPFTFEVSRCDSRAFFIASKYRLSGSHVVYFDGLPLIVETTIHLPSGPQPLWVVHTAAPVHDSFDGMEGPTSPSWPSR